MKRNFYQLTLAILLFAAWAAAQTQMPQQNYPNESHPSAQQTVQQQQPAAQNQPEHPSERPAAQNPQPMPQSDQMANSHVVHSDDALNTRLNRVLAANPRLSDVQAVVNAGQVTLTGTVPTESDRADAKRVIEEAAGVNSVTDEMTIGTPSHLPPGGNAKQSGASSLPQSDAYGKGSSAQGAAQGCECQKGQPNGTYPGTDQPCACTGTSTHGGQSLPSQQQGKPVPPM